ncbi:MAG: reductive dehalogenase [Chloroflexales bacterium]|nr:reductive dehalogenase [Chloroflexales bacterium]
MAAKNGINRRDFLKIGGITAGVLGVAGIMDLVTDGEVMAANDAGGFFIRSHDPDNPPYEVDDALYTPMASAETSFGRSPDGYRIRAENTAKNIAEDTPGNDRLAYAYAAGAATFMFDKNVYSWEGRASNPMHKLPDTRWIPEDHGYTVEDVTKIVRRSAKLYGASLVGIAPLNERWFYTHEGDLAANMSRGDLDLDEMDPAMIRQMLPNILGSMEPEALKAMLLGMLERVDPAMLPDGMSPDMLKNMPAEMVQHMGPKMMENMDPARMAAMMEDMDPSLMPDMSTLAGQMDVGAIMRANAKEIRFSDEIAAPAIQDGVKTIPRSMNRVVVMAFEMDEGGINTENNQLSVGSTANGYSRMAFTSACLANFIRGLGYNAIPMGNDHALSQPMAVDAGLGEIGRNSMLITPKYGPRVRLAKVLTDLPLRTDRPISFGVTEFCEACGKCAERCPSGALSQGNRTYDAPDSGIPGFYHWPVEGDKCFGYWNEIGGGCSECIRVCPFNKPEGWLHDATRILIGVQSGPLNQLLLKLDDAAGYGSEAGDDPRDFWDKDTYIHIKA